MTDEEMLERKRGEMADVRRLYSPGKQGMLTSVTYSVAKTRGLSHTLPYRSEDVV